ncbi:MAG: starch-binding protein [Oscillospiraceae bacterium]|jgi:glycosidase|nr:starch-binding protein [Oscillospiraceae bacterium]
MNKKLNKTRFVAALLAVLICITSCILNVAAVTTDESAVGSGEKIIIHYKSDVQPYVYFWNSLPTNTETTYPGVKMTKDTTQKGTNWYTYTFSNLTKVNLMFTKADGTQLSGELTRSVESGKSGEWWYTTSWRTRNPDDTVLNPSDLGDLREDTIYFIITTRFYDGDTGNNVHCWDDGKAGNPDSDPAWRGDFKGLIDKLDYIKAMGFSAIWVTPVVTNASGYDYHGYHAMDFSTVDIRYESDGATYQDLIDAAHDKGIKIVQDIVLQHTGNFGESFFAPTFTKKYNTIQDLATIETSMVPTDFLLKTFGLNSPEEYYAQHPDVQYQQRLNILKDLDIPANNDVESPDGDISNDAKVSRGNTYNVNNYYHNGYWKSLNYDDWSCKYSQIAGDCVDLNTENPAVADYLTEVYGNYIAMGVDSFRVDTARHISRLSLNMMYNTQLMDSALAAGNDNFYMFGEVCVRGRDVWYRGHACESAQYYTWKEDDSSYANAWQWGTDADSINTNMNLTLQHWSDNDGKTSDTQAPTSTNAFLSGNDYHTPDYSKFSGMGVIDFLMHWSFDTAQEAFNAGIAEDKYYNDSTYNVVYVDSHDYSPDRGQKTRFAGGTDTWAENLSLMFTFRGIPCVYYGSEIEFQKGSLIDVGPNAPLSTTGRAYYGDNLEGSVTASDFSEYTATGKVASTLNQPLAKHIQRLNKIRRAIPALQKGQYSVQGVNGTMAYKRGYIDPQTGKKSFVCVAVTDGATFSNVPNGTYIDAVTGDTKNVTNGSLSIASSGKGNARVYVLSSNGYSGISGKIGESGTFLK